MSRPCGIGVELEESNIDDLRGPESVEFDPIGVLEIDGEGREDKKPGITTTGSSESKPIMSLSSVSMESRWLLGGRCMSFEERFVAL